MPDGNTGIHLAFILLAISNYSDTRKGTLKRGAGRYRPGVRLVSSTHRADFARLIRGEQLRFDKVRIFVPKNTT